MSDVKSVIALLCKHLNLSIGSNIKPESFRLAKYNKGDENVIDDFWTILHDLSACAMKEENKDIDFDRYDDIHVTKLNFAFLQYPTANFYATTKHNKCCSRELLLALGWLIATKNILNVAVRKKLGASVLGHEYSCNENSGTGARGTDEESINLYDEIDSASIVGTQENVRQSVVDDEKSRMRKIVHACGRVSHNVKDIAELLQEKTRLTTKIHAATLNASGLPHLSVFQVAMTKKSCIDDVKDLTKKHGDDVEELRSIAMLLEIHDQWTKKAEHVFYDWMVTVIEESRINTDTSTTDCFTDELSNFLSLLRHVTKKKLHSSKTWEITKIEETRLYEESCPSRFFRTHVTGSEAEIWGSKTTDRLIEVEDEMKIDVERFTSEMKILFKSIPNCVEI